MKKLPNECNQDFSGSEAIDLLCPKCAIKAMSVNVGLR